MELQLFLNPIIMIPLFLSDVQMVTPFSHPIPGLCLRTLCGDHDFGRAYSNGGVFIWKDPGREFYL